MKTEMSLVKKKLLLVYMALFSIFFMTNMHCFYAQAEEYENVMDYVKQGADFKDVSQYKYGFFLFDLFDEKNYAKNGNKIVKAINAIYESSEETIKVELKKKAFGDYYFKKTLDESDYLYFGKLKDGRPDGYGVIMLPEGHYWYVGNFEDGVMKGYGIVFTDTIVVYEGEIASVDRNWNVVPKNGQACIPYYYKDVPGYISSNPLLDTTELEHSEKLYGMRIMPEYIGKIKKGKYSGKGVNYYADGTKKYEGNFEKGLYSGKGKLYDKDGNLLYDGEFKYGKYSGKGTLYRADGSVEYKGNFRNGDVE